MILDNLATTFGRGTAWMSHRLRCFAEDKRGVSAVEFAMLLPLMIALYLGSVEVSQAVSVDRKVTLVARSLSDLVAQSTNISNADMTNILSAATAVIAPYSDTKIIVTVSSVKIDGAGNATISWSDSKNGTPRPKNQAVTLPAALKIANTSLIWAEGQYAYKPAMGYVITGTKTLKDQIYMRPRLSDCVLRESVQTVC